MENKKKINELENRLTTLESKLAALVTYTTIGELTIVPSAAGSDFREIETAGGDSYKETRNQDLLFIQANIAVNLSTNVTGTLSTLNGGTGLNSPFTAGQLMIGTSGGGLAANTLTGGSNIDINNMSGAIQISADINMPNAIGILDIIHGGTGQTTANSAFNALAPSQTGNNNKILKTDGTNTSWVNLSTLSVSSFNTRTGAVTSQTGDYAVSQVTGAAPLASPTFTGTVTVPSPVNATDAVTKEYVDTGLSTKANDASVVHLAGTETITGSKTFSSAIVGNITGNAATVTTNANLTGPVTSSGNVTSITNQAVTYAKIQNESASTLLGNPAGSSTSPSEITLGAGLNFSGSTLVATGSGGTVSSVSVAPANGFSGSVTNPTTTPVISVQTSVTGILKGNGTGVSAAIATDIPTTNSLVSSVNTMNSTVNGVSSNNPIINSHTLNSAVNTITANVNGVSANALMINSNTLSSATNTMTSNINSVSSNTPIINSHTLSSATNTMTSAVNGVSANAAIINSNTLASSTNTMTSTVNGVVSAQPIVNSNTLTLSTTALNSSVNGVTSGGVQVYPSPQSSANAITFDNLTEIVLLVAPSVNAIGVYNVRLKDNSGNELDIIFSVCANQNTSFGNSTLNIMQINDSLGVINATNISSYFLFRGYVRNTTPNSYFVVTISMPYTLIYTNPITMTTWQYGASYLNENFGLTSFIATNIESILITASADLSFKMKLNYVPVSISSPQGYVYEPSSTNVIFQFSINSLTGVLTALSPASIPITGPYKLQVTHQRNYLYASQSSTSSIFMFRISPVDGTLSALSPASITGATLPTGSAIDPTDRFLYICFDTGAAIQMYSITKTTGQRVFQQSVSTAAGMRDCIVHPSGKFLYAINITTGNIYQYSINQSNGQLTALSPATLLTGTTPIQFCIHPNGKYLYVACSGTTSIYMYSINQTTGVLSPLSPATFTTSSNPFGVTVSADGLYIYYCMSVTNQVGMALINTTTGLIVATGPTVAVNAPRHSAIDYTGNYLYVINTLNNRIERFIINQATGALTANGNSPAGTNSNSINPI